MEDVHAMNGNVKRKSRIVRPQFARSVQQQQQQWWDNYAEVPQGTVSISRSKDC